MILKCSLCQRNKWWYQFCKDKKHESRFGLSYKCKECDSENYYNKKHGRNRKYNNGLRIDFSKLEKIHNYGKNILDFVSIDNRIDSEKTSVTASLDSDYMEILDRFSEYGFKNTHTVRLAISILGLVTRIEKGSHDDENPSRR